MHSVCDAQHFGPNESYVANDIAAPAKRRHRARTDGPLVPPLAPSSPEVPILLSRRDTNASYLHLFTNYYAPSQITMAMAWLCLTAPGLIAQNFSPSFFLTCFSMLNIVNINPKSHGRRGMA